MNELMIMAGLFIGLIVFYVFIIRPWQLHWGATPDEVRLSLPGDNLVSKPDFVATRAISIKASPEVIWKWIIQIGSKRAGWYSIDWIDNAGIKSSNSILPQFQQIEVGQFIPFTPDQKNGMWVKEFKRPEYILWFDTIGKATWLWLIIPTRDGARLLTRLRTKYNWKGFWILYYLLFDVGDIIMMRKCLTGIRERAERESV